MKMNGNTNIKIAIIGIDNFISPARGPLQGGPLGRTGLLFAAQGLGSFPAPLSNSAQEAAGFALGYQKLMNNGRRQFAVEIGARFEDDDDSVDEYGAIARFQQALGRRTLIQFDTYASDVENQDDAEYGVRLEFQIKL